MFAGPETQTTTQNKTARHGSDAGRLVVNYDDEIVIVVNKADLNKKFRWVMRLGSLDKYGYEWTLLEFLQHDELLKEAWAHIRNSTLAYADLDEDEVYVIELEVRENVKNEFVDDENVLYFLNIDIEAIDNLDIDFEVDTETKIDIYYYENADEVKLPDEFERIESESEGGDQYIYVEPLLDDLIEAIYLDEPKFIDSKEMRAGHIDYYAYMGKKGDLAIVRVCWC